MEKLNRFVAKHSIAVYAVVTVVWLFAMVALQEWIPLLLVYLVMFFGIWVIARWVNGRGNALLQKPLQVVLHQCDPYPYLAQRQRDYSGVPFLKLMQLINESSALNLVGECRQAYHMLASVDPKILHRVNAYMKAYYYYSLSSLAITVEDQATVELWHSKMLEAISKIRNAKAKRYAAVLERNAAVRIHFVRGEYDLALQVRQTWNETSLYGKVGEAYDYGKIYMAQGELALAKEKMEFVVQNGNRLHLVTVAKEKLAEIDTMEEM